MNELAIVHRTEAQAIEAVKLMANIVLALRKDVLVSGMDYGTIPGTGNKPTLLLPGMEKLMRALNAVPEYIEKCVIRDYDRPLFHYEYECRLIEADTGLAIPGGRGIGLCTSFESAFRWRKGERVCPKCEKPAIKKSQFPPKNDKNAPPGWYCYSKAGGCGAEFAHNDITITSQDVGRVANLDIFDQVNAIMKRAKKRALGDAIKGAANVSEFFTVDVEDFARFDDVVEGEYIEVQPEKPATPKGNVTEDKKPTTPAPSKSALDILDAGLEEFGVNFATAANVLKLKDINDVAEWRTHGTTPKLIAEKVKLMQAEKPNPFTGKPATDSQSAFEALPSTRDPIAALSMAAQYAEPVTVEEYNIDFDALPVK